MGRPSQRQAEPLSTAAGPKVRADPNSGLLPGGSTRTTLGLPTERGHLANDTLIRGVLAVSDRLKQEPITDQLLTFARQLR